jgi:hypothetical protein
VILDSSGNAFESRGGRLRSTVDTAYLEAFNAVAAECLKASLERAKQSTAAFERIRSPLLVNEFGDSYTRSEAGMPPARMDGGKSISVPLHWGSK